MANEPVHNSLEISQEKRENDVLKQLLATRPDHKMKAKSDASSKKRDRAPKPKPA